MENFDDKYKKKNPFTVPEGYFDELTGRITGRIEKQKEVKKSSSLRGLKPYMGLVAIFFLALMVVQILFPGAKNTDLPDIEGENAIVQEMEAFVNLLIFVLFAIIMNSSEDKKNVRRDEDEKYFILF